MRSFALSTGSSGNAYYIESNKGVKVLVDVGLSYSKSKEILEEKGIAIKDIRALFITHEHSDHVAGLSSFLKHLNIPIYLTKGTFSKLEVDEQECVFVKHHTTLTLEDLKILVYEKPHDAQEAVHFVFDDGKKLGVFTDFGHVTDEIKHVMKNVDMMYFETNYCEDKVQEVKHLFHFTYLHRLTSDHGHLSLQQACDALCDAAHNTQTIVLSHISENTNSYVKAYETVVHHLKKKEKYPQVLVSFQGEPTPWLE